MAIIKVYEATGPVLDWMVAKCEGRPYVFSVTTGGDYNGNTTHGHLRRYSVDWNLGGPIIHREKIGIREWSTNRFPDGWFAGKGCGEPDAPMAEGETPLIAAMRCYVLSKLGETVEVPEELI